MTISRSDAREIIRGVLAADLACAAEDFQKSGVLVIRAEKRPGRRAFPWREKPLNVVSFGSGVVVSAADERLPWLRETLGDFGPGEVFSAPTIAALERLVAADGQTLVGPQLKFACAEADLRETRPPDAVALNIVEGDALRDFARLDGFRNALTHRDRPERPDVLAVAATEEGRVVGIAGASADCDRMWQIGVDVVAPARERGIGRAMVGALTGEILRRGRVPYYTTAISNLASRTVAQAVGFWPAWVELYAVDPVSSSVAPAATGIAPTLTDGAILLDGYTLADVAAQVEGEDDEFARRFGWYPNHSTAKTVGDSILQRREDWRASAPTRAFAARDAQTRALLGGCEIRLQGDGIAHFSWWTLAPYRRRGAATRAVRLAAAYTFAHLGVRRLEAYVETDNLGSRGVARAAGFTEEGILRKQAMIGGEARDMVLYALLKGQ